MDKINSWLIRIFAVVFICVCRITYLNSQKKQSLLLSKPSIEDLKYKTLEKKRANAEFAAKRDYTDYEKFGSIIFVMLHSIVDLNQQTMRNKWNCIFLEKKEIYQNGILLSKIMKTKEQNVETLILEMNIMTRFGGFCSSNNALWISTLYFSI